MYSICHICQHVQGVSKKVASKILFGYELPTNLQNFTQRDLSKVKKIFKNVLGGATFLKHPIDLHYTTSV